MPSPAPRTRRLRRSEVPAYLKENFDIDRAETTLAKLASLGGGPPMEYAGRYPLYPEDGLIEWARALMSPRVASTSELRALRAA